MALVSVLFFAFLGLIFAFLAFHSFIFLRDPERSVPPGKNIVAPADGRVIDVIPWKDKPLRLSKSIASFPLLCSDVAPACNLVRIFMSPFNVHVNRIPCDGKVVSIKYSRGSFVYANSLKALENERNEVLLSTGFGRIKVVQVAGFLARRIECWLKPNHEVVKGQRFGRINLGSQVVAVLPARLRIRVAKGDRVKAGLTIIASP
jgi:phosphatidylserine decarboxylase